MFKMSHPKGLTHWGCTRVTSSANERLTCRWDSVGWLPTCLQIAQ